MRVVLIDDEKLPLLYLKKMLETSFTNIDIVGIYQNPLEAYEQMTVLSPDVVFLDIQMPGVNGLEMAGQIQELLPDVEIVFITGFDRYAIQAFEVFAFDYILKPLQLKRLQRTIDRLINKIGTKEQISLPTNKKIKCFSKLSFSVHGNTEEDIKWRTSKAFELFAYFLHYRNQVIDRESLIELLWPDFDTQRGAQQLYTTVYHIRKLLKQIGFDEMTISSEGNLGGGYILKTNSIQIDIEEWENSMKELPPPHPTNIKDHMNVFHQYEGDYLGSYHFLWAEAEKERLRRLWLNHGKLISTFHLQKGDVQAAIKIFERIQKLCPLEEEAYFELMKLYASINLIPAVEEQFWLLEKLCREELDTSPQTRVINWFNVWKKKSFNHNLKILNK